MHGKPKEIIFVFSDMHLGEGRRKNGRPNMVEYFEADEEFSKTICAIMEEYKGAPLVLHFLGDTFDFLTVEDNGRFLAEHEEEPAVRQIKKIFSAHPLVIGAMRDFLSAGGKIKFFIGNHDLALAWVNVKNFIRRELTRGWAWVPAPHPINFIMRDPMAFDQKIKFVFKETKNGAHFEHGNNAEAVHATPEDKMFIAKKYGKQLLLPLLRHPYGNHSYADLASRLARGSRWRKENYWIGRMNSHWFVFLKAFCEDWWFGISAILLWLFLPFKHRFFSRRWWVRKSAGLFKLFRYNAGAAISIIWNTFGSRDHKNYARKILRENSHVDVVFIGHFHECWRETHEKHGTCISPGNWSVTYEAEFPRVILKWKRFKRLEKIIKTVCAARMMFNKKTRHMHVPKKRELYSFGVCKFFEDGCKEIALMRYNPQKNHLEEML